MAILTKKLIDRFFEIGILVKSFFGFFEVLAGIALVISGRLVVNNFIIALVHEEILEDPNDFLANFLINVASNFSVSSTIFAAAYLIFHGVVNILLIIALVKNKIWAYPWAMAGFGIFIIYQIFRYFHTFSPLLLLLTVFDIFLVLVIWVEYKRKIKINKQSAKTA